MFRKSLIVLFASLVVLFMAGSSGADPMKVSSLVKKVSLGMTVKEVSKHVQGLKKISVSFKKKQKKDRQVYQLPKPSGDIASLKCVFASGKLSFLLIETKDGRFASAKESVEKKYGKFSQKDVSSVFEQKKDRINIRLLRTGEDGTAAKIMIGKLE